MDRRRQELARSWVIGAVRPGWILALLPCFLLTGCALVVSQPTGGIRGTMLSGPTCPVVGPNTGAECDDQPFAGTVVVRTEDGSREVGRVTADASGVFEIALNPGTYLLVPQPGETGFPIAEQQTIQVQADAFTNVTILFDTGIR